MGSRSQRYTARVSDLNLVKYPARQESHRSLVFSSETRNFSKFHTGGMKLNFHLSFHNITVVLCTKILIFLSEASVCARQMRE